MGARYPYYLLADSPDGQRKEAEITRKAPSEAPTRGDVRQGFVYERVPHITLKSIANNAEIDVIWERWQETLEPLRDDLNARLDGDWAGVADSPRGGRGIGRRRRSRRIDLWWEARIARQQGIDASIAARADYEYLYDKPYEDSRKVRVAGPFTVESLSPHRVLAIDEDDELIDRAAEPRADYGPRQDFAAMILEQLATAGVQQAHKEDRIAFAAVTPWPGELHLRGGTLPRSRWTMPVAEKRAGVFVGPEFGTVSRPDLVAAAREAGDAGFDVLIACAFNYEAHASEFNRLGRIPVLKARMNADLHMADELKNTGKGNLFVIFGEPDIDILPTDGDERRQHADPGEDQRRGRLPSDHRRGPQRRRRRHRLLVHRHRLQRGELLRPARLLPRRERPLQGAQDDAEGRDRRRRVGDAPQRHLASVRSPGVGPHRRQGHQPPRRRGDEGVPGVSHAW